MAVPIVNVFTDQEEPYAPGDPITVTWTVIDADNSTETIAFSGVDDEGNQVTGEIVINRQDEFTMQSVTWARTGQAFVVDNNARSASSIVPSA